MSRKERLALFSLLAVAVIGHAVRLVALGPNAAPGGLVITKGLEAGNLARHRAESARAGRPLAAQETIDLNQASAGDLNRLPGVGANLAKSIVAARDRSQGFTSLAELDQVGGIGPAMLERLATHLTLGDT